MSSTEMTNGNGSDGGMYNNNRGCLPLYKKEFLPHGLCHFYLRHGYCKNKPICRWDHPPLGMLSLFISNVFNIYCNIN